MIETTLGRVAAGEDLSMEDMSAAIESIMNGQWEESQISLLLTGLNIKGETFEEIAGAAQAMRRHMTPIRTRRTGLIDTCGTGGDGSGTFNISTAAALLTAAAGVPVAKHGNRGVTSKSGSADVLAALGVNIEADVATTEACLDELGICFCFAPLLHLSMKHVAAVRKMLGVPTIFNLLGPLSNPAGAEFQLLGVGRRELLPLLSAALELLGTQHAVVVCGEDGLDEVTLSAATHVVEVGHGPARRFTWNPADFGLKEISRDALLVDGPVESQAVISDILAGNPGPRRDIVVANAAAALWTAGKADTVLQGAGLAAEAIDSGRAKHLLARLVERTAP